MKFKTFIEESKKDYSKLDSSLKEVKDGTGRFILLNNKKGKFTLTYRAQENDEKGLKKLAKKGFSILKKFYPNAKEIHSDFSKFPYEKGSYDLVVEYNLGEK